MFHERDYYIPPLDSTRPVIALDVDGVLRPVIKWSNNEPLPGDGALPGYQTFPISISEDIAPVSPFHRKHPGGTIEALVLINPKHGEWINELLEFADVVWATTWEASANLLAPMLGIPELPVGISVTKNPPRFGHVRNGDTGGWKKHALDENYPHRALAWVDDMIPWHHSEPPGKEHGWEFLENKLNTTTQWRDHWEEDLKEGEMPTFEQFAASEEWGKRSVLGDLPVLLDGKYYRSKEDAEDTTGHDWQYVDEHTKLALSGPRYYVKTTPQDGLIQHHMDKVTTWAKNVAAGKTML